MRFLTDEIKTCPLEWTDSHQIEDSSAPDMMGTSIFVD